MNNLSHLQILTEQVYGKKIQKFTNLDSIFEEKLDFDNFVYNAYLHYLKNGEVVHLNRVLNAAKHLNRYREIRAVYRPLTAHRWTDGPGGILDAKAKANKKKLRHIRQHGENAFLMAFANEQGKQQTARGFDLDNRLQSLIKSAEKAGYTLADIQNGLMAANNSVHKSEKIRKAA